MKKIKRILAVSLTLVMLASCGGGGGGTADSGAGSSPGAAASGDAGEKIVWKVGHNNAENHQWELNMLMFADLVHEASGGQIEVQTFPNSQLGDDVAMCELIRNGNLDMMVTGGGVPGRWYSPMNLMEMPYLFNSIDHVEKCVYGLPGEMMNDGLLEQDMMAFDYWLRANRQILSTVPIESLEDVQGLKIRVPETDIWVSSMQALGTNPTPVAFSEAFTALQQGVVNAIENPLSSMYGMRFHEVCNYLAITNHTVSFTAVLASPRSWDKLTPEQQAILLDCGRQVREHNNALVRDEDQEFIDLMSEEVDLTITYPDYEPFAGKVRAIHPEMAEKSDATEIYEAIRALV